MEGLQVEFRVPVSPTPEFALMLSVLSSSLRRHGGIHKPRVTVFIGAEASDIAASEALAEWLPPDMTPVIVDPADFEARSFYATAARRLTLSCDSDVVILIDADVVVCGDLSDICEQTVTSPAVSGVIAHMAPISNSDWRKAFRDIGAAAEFPFRYTGWPYMGQQKNSLTESPAAAPAYFNFGFVAATPALLQQIAGCYEKCFAAVEHLFPGLIYRAQVALTLALATTRSPVRALPMRYNFANDYRLEALHPAELRDARLIHLLRRGQGIDKQELYRDLDAVRAFVSEPSEVLTPAVDVLKVDA